MTLIIHTGLASGGDLAEQLDPVFWDQKGAAFPVGADTRAYYPKVLHDESAPFSSDGVTFYKWVALYAGSGSPTMTAVFSDDGLTWVNPVKVSGIVPAGYHVEMVVVGDKLKIWYWIGVLNYTVTDIRTAECDLDSIPQFSGDQACANGSVAWITGNPGDWNRGSYGISKVFYNPNPTNDPNDPSSYRYCCFFDGTTGGTEDTGVAVSDDGVTWDLYDPNPIIARGAPGAWDDNYLTWCDIWRRGGQWVMLYSGGTGGSDEGMGLAYSPDLVNWTKFSPNPVFVIGSGNWASRCYTPCVVDGYRLYYTGDDGGGTRAVYIADEAEPWTKKVTTYDTDNQGYVV